MISFICPQKVILYTVHTDYASTSDMNGHLINSQHGYIPKLGCWDWIIPKQKRATLDSELLLVMEEGTYCLGQSLTSQNICTVIPLLKD